MKVGAKFNQNRTNEEWVSAVRGDMGPADQREAHEALFAYLFTTGLNYLWTRQPTVNLLAQYGNDELAALAEDFVQQFCCKLIKNEYALLSKYDARGRFLSWSAQVLRNIIASELRRREWQRSERLTEKAVHHQGQTVVRPLDHPELVFQSNQLTALIEDVLDHVSPRNRTVFLRYVVDGERANVVADALGMSVNSVYSSAHRMKAMVRRVLVNAEYA